ncbi:uncharacterized protein LOC111628239 [Centruroides sculpturatus]|uniref:uncharacterized protein LOC111628239 n=1 Tax=Centruroides sculpturatus TaxID=218467 RepID=UPI000C6EAA8E|nr:uncharacterized protein LOC111628239 [Centruroides sculpturatus]
MELRRNRQFYKRGSVYRRQRRPNPVNFQSADDYISGFVATDPTYNYISFMDNYMAYFVPPFFPPSSYTFQHAEFAVSTRDLMNGPTCSSWINRPPRFRNMQRMNYRRQKTPRCNRTRIFWRQKSIDKTQTSEEQVVKREYSEQEELEENGYFNRRTNRGRSRNEKNVGDDEVSISAFADVTNEKINESDKESESAYTESNGSKDDVKVEDNIELPFFREQLEIFKLLKECDDRHEIRRNSGMSWFESEDIRSDQSDSDTEDDVQIIIRTSKYNSENLAKDHNQENVNPNLKKRKSNSLWLDIFLLSLKKKLIHTTDEQKRIQGMGIKSQVLKEKLKKHNKRKKYNYHKSKFSINALNKMDNKNVFSYLINKSAFSDKMKDEKVKTDRWTEMVESANSSEFFSLCSFYNFKSSRKVSVDLKKEQNAILERKTEFKPSVTTSRPLFPYNNMTDLEGSHNQTNSEKIEKLDEYISKEFVSEMSEWFDINVKKEFCKQKLTKSLPIGYHKCMISRPPSVKPKGGFGDGTDTKRIDQNIEKWSDLEITESNLLMEKLKRNDLARSFAFEMMNYLNEIEEYWKLRADRRLQWHFQTFNKKPVQEVFEHYDKSSRHSILNKCEYMPGILSPSSEFEDFAVSNTSVSTEINEIFKNVQDTLCKSSSETIENDEENENEKDSSK